MEEDKKQNQPEMLTSVDELKNLIYENARLRGENEILKQNITNPITSNNLPSMTVEENISNNQQEQKQEHPKLFINKNWI